MLIILSDHAKDQIKRRKIPLSQVRKTLQNPVEIIPSFRGRKLQRRRVGGKMLEVVIKTEDSKIVVITAYYLKEKNYEN